MDILTYTLEKKVPFAVQFNLTGRCNLQCVHCCVEERGPDKENGNGNGNRRKSRQLSGELNLTEIERILRQLAQAGCLMLTLSGGEVSLRPDLLDIIECARRQNFAVRVFTNGTLLMDKEVKAFRKMHVQEVHVSVYAAEDAVHDEITGVIGSWEKTIEGIRLLREEEIPVKIKCAVMQQNVKNYREVYDLALDLGAGYAFDPIITARDDGNKDTIKYRISQQDLQRIFDDPLFKGDPKEGGIEAIENFSCLLSEVYEDVPCSAGHNICFISPEGDVTPCVQLPISCGNLRAHDFDWIWYHSQEMLRIRQMRVKDIYGCQGCEYLHWCARCPGLAYLEDGDLLGPSSAACWMTMARARGSMIANFA